MLHIWFFFLDKYSFIENNSLDCKELLHRHMDLTIGVVFY